MTKTKENRLETIDYKAGKNAFIEFAILGGFGITEALKYWDDNYKGEKGFSIAGEFDNRLLDETIRTKEDVIDFIAETGASESSKGFFTKRLTLALRIEAKFK